MKRKYEKEKVEILESRKKSNITKYKVAVKKEV